jgi:DNA-binding response OmpR family regulator
MRILLVEDDENIVKILQAALTRLNYVVDAAPDGEVGWQMLEAVPYDLVLLDIMLPKLDGISFCRRLREQNNQVMVIMLTACDTKTDKLRGLDNGADDYIVKPFDIQELVARMRAVLRRRTSIATPILTCGDLRLDTATRQVSYAGISLQISRKEYLLLELLLQNQERVFSRRDIVSHLWSLSEEPPNEETIKSHIKSIRRKLETVGAGNIIETLYGQGYRIKANCPTRNTQPGGKVLAMDGDSGVLMLLKAMLEGQGLQLLCLNNPDQLWQVLETAQPELLILEIHEPAVDGLDLCQSVRRNPHWDWLPILVLTMHNDRAAIQEIFAAGADDYLVKPFQTEELFIRVFNRLQRSRRLRNHQFSMLPG